MSSTPHQGHQRLMLDVQASASSTVPFELFDASQTQLREAAVALSRHKSSLASALGEVNNLRSMVSALETNVETLKFQNEDMFEKLRESRRNEELLITQVTKLTDATEFLSQQLQVHAKSAAQRYSNLQEVKDETEAALRLKIDRLTDQLISSQSPQTRAIPWSHTFKQADHPAHAVRLVVQADASRENRMMRLQLSGAVGGNDDDGVSDLERLLHAANSSEAPPSSSNSNSNINNNYYDSSTKRTPPFVGCDPRDVATSQNVAGSRNNTSSLNNTNDIFFSDVTKTSGFEEDAQLWRSVCRRLHQVLSERRSLLRTKQDGPLEFLLRTRHELAAAVVQMREDVKKVSVVLNTMLEKMASKSFANSGAATGSTLSSSGPTFASSSSSNSSNHNNNNTITLKVFEGSIEILQTFVSDLSHTIQRALSGCLTDADRVLLGLTVSTTDNNNNNNLQARWDKALSYRANRNNTSSDKSNNNTMSSTTAMTPSVRSRAMSTAIISSTASVSTVISKSSKKLDVL